nr:hypothetical protein DBT41_10945 [Aerococcus urinae]
MDGISWKAVIVSSIFNFLLMLTIITLGVLVVAGFESPDGTVPSEAEVSATLESSWLTMLALTPPLAAGYLGAAMAKRAAILHGALSSSLNVAWGVICMIFLTPVTLSGLALLAANPLLGAAGGYIWLKARNS